MLSASAKKLWSATKIDGYREMTRVYFLTMAGVGVRFFTDWMRQIRWISV